MKNLIIVALILGFIGYSQMKKEKPKTNEPEGMDKALLDAFTKATVIYHSDITKNADRIYQYETNHFANTAFVNSLSAGMSAFSEYYPYGWPSLDKFWTKNPQYKPLGVMSVHDYHTENPVLVFPTIEAGIMTLCEILSQNKNNVGAYHSKDKAQQFSYSDEISKITPAYVL